MAEVIPVSAEDFQSYEALRRVKAAETEWADRVAAARKESEATVARLRDEADATVKAAQAEAEQERAAAVQRAREDADREAAVLLDQGKAAAEEITAGEGRRPSDRRGPILEAVLGEFASD